MGQSPSSTVGDSLSASTTRRVFRGRSYGHEAVFSPVTAMLNRGYEIIQVANHPREIFEFDYPRAMGAVFDGLSNPGAAIERVGGWKEFLTTEVFPVSHHFDDAKWFPNYTEHLLAGGLQSRMLADWYDMRGAPYPRILAGLTSLAAGFMNEVIEHPNTDVGAASSVADLYIFDLGGVILFNSWDGLARFFVEELHAADWSALASITFPDKSLHNNGLYFVYKIPLPFLERTRFFWRLGLGSQAGLTYRVDDEYSFSFGLGVDTKSRDVDPVTLVETIEVVYSGGLFLDRDDSLLASLMVSERFEDVLALNVYPGVLPGALSDVGVWLTMARDGATRFGLVHRRALGLGLGLNW